MCDTTTSTDNENKCKCGTHRGTECRVPLRSKNNLTRTAL